MRLTETSRSLKTALIVLFTAVVILYIGFHGRYLAEYIDDAWVMSWAWNLYKHGEVRDTVFGEPGGGTVHFQRTIAIVYGAIASVLGWTRGVGYGVSKFFVVASSVCWYFIIRKLGLRKAAAWIFVGVMLLMECYFGIANKIRQEPIGLFFCSISLLLFVIRRYLFSGLLLGIAVEAHPFTFIGGFWILAYLFVLWPELKADPKKYLVGALSFLGGLVLGFGYWLMLHGLYVNEMVPMNRSPIWGTVGHGLHVNEMAPLSRITIGNIFQEYYFTSRYSWRHWPEAVMIIVAIAIFVVRKKHRDHPFVLPFLVAVVTASLVISRGNIHYIVYLYPAAILVILTVAEDLGVTPLLVFGLLLFQLPQYAWLFWNQKEYNHRAYIAELRKAVPPGHEPVYGHPNAWFAFQEREFYGYAFFDRAVVPPQEWPESFLVLETSDFERWGGRYDLARGTALYVREDLAEWIYWDGNPVRVYRLRR